MRIVKLLYVLKNLDKGTLLQKLALYLLSIKVLTQCSAKIFAHNSISPHEIYKDFLVSGLVAVKILPSYENAEKLKVLYILYSLTISYNPFI